MPMTIDGTPVITTARNRTSRANVLSLPYSWRYTAPSTPSGIAIAAAPNVTSRVPTIAGAMPGPGASEIVGMSSVKNLGKSATSAPRPFDTSVTSTATSGSAIAANAAIISPVMIWFLIVRHDGLARRSTAGVTGGATIYLLPCDRRAARLTIALASMLTMMVMKNSTTASAISAGFLISSASPNSFAMIAGIELPDANALIDI